MATKKFSVRRYYQFILPALILYAVTWEASNLCGASFSKFGHGFFESLGFIHTMFPPDWAAFRDMIQPAFQSIVIAFLGTVFGTIISVGFALIAASNLTVGWVRNTARFLIGLERALPEIVILLLLVAAFGLGSMPAVIALTLSCIGMIGKLLADVIEEIDSITLDSIASVGANKLQVITFGVLPVILPNIVSYALFRFEINIRLSVILGAIGAGGIGYELNYSFNNLEYHRALTALLVILSMVFITERFSLLLRGRLNTQLALQ